MGFFSKKTIICERCGKEYQARITLGCHICNECLDRGFQKQWDLHILTTFLHQHPSRKL